MSNTYTQLIIQLVFAVKGRKSFISETWEEELYKYITAVVQNDRHKMLAINGMPDHIHILIGLNPAISISDLVKDIKRSRSNWINDKKGQSKINLNGKADLEHFLIVDLIWIKFINIFKNQKIHHKKVSFKSEYLTELKANEIEYKDEYLFEYYE